MNSTRGHDLDGTFLFRCTRMHRDVEMRNQDEWTYWMPVTRRGMKLTEETNSRIFPFLIIFYLLP